MIEKFSKEGSTNILNIKLLSSKGEHVLKCKMLVRSSHCFVQHDWIYVFLVSDENGWVKFLPVLFKILNQK